MSKPFVKYGGMTKEEWLASPEGPAWLRKVRERDGEVSLSTRFGTMEIGEGAGTTVALRRRGR